MVTRFRPTPSGDLHCGHVWVAYHNWRRSHWTGAPFILIGDDLCYNLQYLGEQWFPFGEALSRIVEDLTWMGMAPDEVVCSTANAEAHAVATEKLGIVRPSRNQYRGGGVGLDTVRGGVLNGNPGDDYHPWLVMCRVVDDHEAGVEGFCRGQDLIGERQLYDFLARRLRYNPPIQEYLPLLYRENEPGRLKDSKSGGSPSIRQLRAAGYAPEQIMQTLHWCAEVSLQERRIGVMVPQGYLEPGAVRWQPWHMHAVRLAEPQYAPERVPEVCDAATRRYRRLMRQRLGIETPRRPEKQGG